MLVNNYRPTQEDRKEKRRTLILKRAFFCVLLLCMVAAVATVAYEMHTSRFQAQEISRYATTLTYNLKPGPSNKLVYPESGPFDLRLGYTQMPQMLDRVKSRGMEIEFQAEFSPVLIDYTSKGFFTPYPEKTQAGLNIVDSHGKTVHHSPYPKHIYTGYDSIPPIVVQSLLFIENRGLLDADKPLMNPAVDWRRFTKAILHEAARTIGLNYESLGGSTLSTQVEKYRHSPKGITTGPTEKLRQMISASVRAYQRGPNTLPARQNIILSYLNTVPLSGAPGYGEVHGLGDGLWVWFGTDVKQANQLLSLPEAKGDTLKQQGQALRQVISLMIAQRRPSYFLSSEGHAELNALSGSYLRLMANSGYISPELRDAGLAQEVALRDFKDQAIIKPAEINKGALMARTHLAELLDKPLYDLDRLDLSVTTTLQYDLQEQISSYLSHLNEPEFAVKAGVLGERLLSPNRIEQVQYSFTLFERTPNGNVVRVQTDNTGQPFDLNAGSKLELGSTAKLRVFVTYLEVVAEIHKRYADATKQDLQKALREPQDNLTRWVVAYMIRTKDRSLSAILNAALERRYSANPHELFFTGGGLHTFRNFQNTDNGKTPTVREALLKSINLPFIRLLRDLVLYSSYQTAGNRAKLLADEGDPRRREYLTKFADREGEMYLLRFWRKYKNKTHEERFNTFLIGLRQDPVRLGAVHRYLYPETDSISFEKFLRSRLPKENLTNERIMELYHRYGPDSYNLSDQGYIARAHPLELWLLNYMLQNPEVEWPKVVDASKDVRQEVYKWLFRTRFKHARDSRIRTMLEMEAFEDIQQRWKRLGYPFDKLVPSLATALGSSGDRPEALAELMGIIINDGVRQRTLRVEKLHFAANTPYETALRWSPVVREQVMESEVATIVRETLSEVVNEGTARRLKGGFAKADGEALQMGGKTGTGDNRLVTLSTRGQRLASRALNRTATFVFFLGDKHFGTLTAFVPGREAADYRFTSSLPVQVLKGMAPILEPYIDSGTDNLHHVAASPSQVGEQPIALKEGTVPPKDVQPTSITPASNSEAPSPF